MLNGYLVYQANSITWLLGFSGPAQIINIAIFLLLGYLAVVFILLPLSAVAMDIVDFNRLRKRHSIFLELTPPAYSTKSIQATKQLFAAIHGLAESRRYKDKLLRRKNILSLEVVATRKNGIRYLVQLSETDVQTFQQLMAVYLPQATFKITKDYLSPETIQVCQVAEFKQAGHFAYPLATYESLWEHDPIAYIAGSMVKPKPGELIAYQLVVSAASPRVAAKVHSKLLTGKDAGLQWRYWQMPVRILFKTQEIIIGLLSVLFSSSREELDASRTKLTSTKKQRPLSQANSEVMQNVHKKLSQPLFNLSVRVLVVSENSQRLNGIANALYMFHVPGYQGLVARRNFPRGFTRPYRIDAFAKRLPAMLTTHSSIVAASELAELYHFPYGEHGQTEDIVSSLSRTLPAPLSIKTTADNNAFDVILGKNIYHGSETPLGLTVAERERHVYMIGATGSGKTTMLQYAIVQDIQASKGVAVIDPHGDLAEALLRYIPPERINDVVYFNPCDINYPIGLNLLELPKGISEEDLLIEQDFITESIVSVFRKIFSDDDSGGHRIEHFLRNAIHTAFTVEDATLFTVYKLLTNTTFRRSIVNKLEDSDLIDFWQSEFNSAGDYQKVKMSSGVNAKLGRFRRSVVTRRILEQPASTINFDDIIQNKKILICNFSKGQIGEDTSSLLGTSILTKLQLAALRRSRILRDEREPFYLYVDEFQNLATSSFGQILSEARKYKLFLTMAEQTTSQQEDRRLTEVILANVGTVVCFRTGSVVDERLMLPLFKPYIKEGEISNLPAFNFYARLMAINAQKPLSGETLLLEDRGKESVAKAVIEQSRKQYGVDIRSVSEDDKAKKKNANVSEQKSNDEQPTKVASSVMPIGP